MMIVRRDFLRLAGKMGADTVYDVYGSELDRLFARPADGSFHAVWLRGTGDTGCTGQLLQGAGPELAEIITEFRLAIDFHPELMIASADSALFSLTNALAGRASLDLLIVEGAVSAAGGGAAGETAGRPVPFATWVRDLAGVARQVVAVGSCAALGGSAAAQPDAAGYLPVSSLVTRTPLINIPGCPAHPDWVILTLATLLSGSVPALDARLRPLFFFHEALGNECPLEEYCKSEQSSAAQGCLHGLSCRGTMNGADCPLRLWNGAAGACQPGPPGGGHLVYTYGAPCVGCPEPEWGNVVKS